VELFTEEMLFAGGIPVWRDWSLRIQRRRVWQKLSVLVSLRQRKVHSFGLWFRFSKV